MRLSWNEIRARAAAFADEWKDAHYEKGETQSFYEDFFQVFGIKRRSVAVYEKRVEKLTGNTGFIDLFWPQVLLVEQKSKGKNLKSARLQAEDYFLSLKETERPRYILACDFQNFDLYDLEENTAFSFKLKDLPDHVERFGFIMGVQKVAFKDQDPVNIKAAELIGDLHDKLEEAGFKGTDLERFLVRIVFCLFADDTGVFQPRNLFLEWLEGRTSKDGHDLGAKLSELFQTLDTPENQRGALLDEDLALFPYVNGDLFNGATRIPAFNSEMREALIAASRFDWSPISPAIFGSLFQSVMNKEERRKAGAHYTTEKNILKVIGPLFLDDLKAEFESIDRRNRNREGYLRTFHRKLGELTFFDPACGCGNFLIIAYREIRRLEIQVLASLLKGRGQDLEGFAAGSLSRIDVDQFYGIEIGEFAAEIARTAMWIMDHIMNNELSRAFGQNYARIPLSKSANIILGNALKIRWNDVLLPEQCSYVFGNPPFVGKKEQSKEQKNELGSVFDNIATSGELDYVAAWFELARRYISLNRKIKVGFVSTKSICQGEQASVLWSAFIADKGFNIFYCHQVFAWGSEAKNAASVHVVIIGFSYSETKDKAIYEYANVSSEPTLSKVKNINPYLIDGDNILVQKRRATPDNARRIQKGSEATDWGYLLFSREERAQAIEQNGVPSHWFKLFLGGDEYINGLDRYCLWLEGISTQELRKNAFVMNRIKQVREKRLSSSKSATVSKAEVSWLFGENRQPKEQYLIIPKVSSQRRDYVPIGVLDPDVIVSGSAQLISGFDLPTFSLVTSTIHMAWMRTVGGRTKSDYQYTNTLVYNTFPWPDLTDNDIKKLTETGHAILDARAKHPDATLADLYDPNTMPPDLRKAHRANDKAVDKLYRSKAFENERERVEHLFELYENLRAPLQT